MSIYTFLKSDHNQFKKLCKQISTLKAKEEVEQRMELFNQLKEAVLVHGLAEEKTLYAKLKKFDESKDIATHSVQEHKNVETLFEELSQDSFSGTSWDKKFEKLTSTLEHHLQEEEEEMFKKAKRLLNEGDEILLESEMRKQKIFIQRELLKSQLKPEQVASSLRSHETS